MIVHSDHLQVLHHLVIQHTLASNSSSPMQRGIFGQSSIDPMPAQQIGQFPTAFGNSFGKSLRVISMLIRLQLLSLIGDLHISSMLPRTSEVAYESFDTSGQPSHRFLLTISVEGLFPKCLWLIETKQPPPGSIGCLPRVPAALL